MVHFVLYTALNHREETTES